MRPNVRGITIEHLHFQTSSVLRRRNLKKQLINHENGTVLKRSLNRSNLKTPALHFSVDGKHFENGLFENDDFTIICDEISLQVRVQVWTWLQYVFNKRQREFSKKFLPRASLSSLSILIVPRRVSRGRQSGMTEVAPA